MLSLRARNPKLADVRISCGGKQGCLRLQLILYYSQPTIWGSDRYITCSGSPQLFCWSWRVPEHSYRLRCRRALRLRMPAAAAKACTPATTRRLRPRKVPQSAMAKAVATTVVAPLAHPGGRIRIHPRAKSSRGALMAAFPPVELLLRPAESPNRVPRVPLHGTQSPRQKRANG